MNAQINLLFNKPVDFIDVMNGVHLSTGGQAVAGSFALSQWNELVTFTPGVNLVANTPYALTVSATVTNLTGSPVNNPGTLQFQTGPAADFNAPIVLQSNPPGNSTGARVNTVVQLLFDKAIDPLTLISSTFQVVPQQGAFPIPGSIALSADSQTATFTPSAALDASTAYVVNTNGIADLEGHLLSFCCSDSQLERRQQRLRRMREPGDHPPGN